MVLVHRIRNFNGMSYQCEMDGLWNDHLDLFDYVPSSFQPAADSNGVDLDIWRLRAKAPVTTTLQFALVPPTPVLFTRENQLKAAAKIFEAKVVVK